MANVKSAKKKTVFDKVMNPPFEPYWTKERVQAGLKRGELVQGTLRVNQKKFEEAFIDDPDRGPDFFVNGILSRNRAFQEDKVVIQVLPREEWIHSDSSAIEATNAELPDLAKLSLTKGSDPVMKETLVDRLYSKIQVSTSVDQAASRKTADPIPNNVRRTAKVVYVVEKVHSRTCAGYLKAYDKVKNLALFSPRDNKAPRVFLPLAECPEDLCQRMKKYETNLFIVYIGIWPEQSPFPFGKLMRSLGEAGEVEGETEAMLLENDVDCSEFSKQVLDCLPKESPWTVPQEEIAKRRDFRRDCVFTIDPETAKDLDDALHVKKLENGTYEVGVHIADVSYFVRAGSALDLVASERATSVYLVQKVIPMLPRLLCEQLCSLNPDKDRLTFSVVWTLSKKGEFLSEWMGKSLIRSCTKLSYDDAQIMIDSKMCDENTPAISGGYSAKEVAEAVNILNELATSMRALRQSKGTLRLDQIKLKYSIDPSTGLPNGCQVYRLKESNKLIEEFMLMANMAVARKCYQAFPEVALLRRHPYPKDKSAEMLRAKFREFGITLDTSTAGALQVFLLELFTRIRQTSLDSFSGRSVNPSSNQMEKLILVSQCARIMELAKYFCTGSVEVDRYHHYALNVPFYTHFTSPIRRYADVVVHRLLAAALGEDVPFQQSCDDVESQATHCNKKKKAAKVVEELSSELFLAIFIKECGPIRCQGMVTTVLDKSFDVFVKDFGVIKRVYCERIKDLKKFTFINHGPEHGPQLTLQWLESASKDSTPITQVLQVFTKVSISVCKGSSSPLQYEVIIHPESLSMD